MLSPGDVPGLNTQPHHPLLGLSGQRQGHLNVFFSLQTHCDCGTAPHSIPPQWPERLFQPPDALRLRGSPRRWPVSPAARQPTRAAARWWPTWQEAHPIHDQSSQVLQHPHHAYRLTGLWWLPRSRAGHLPNPHSQEYNSPETATHSRHLLLELCLPA